MKTRPSREELAAKFFGDMADAVGADREQSKAYNLIAHEVIIRDLLGKFDEGWNACGPGILCLDLRDQRPSEYKTLEVIMEVADEAKSAGDKATMDLMNDTAKVIKNLNYDHYGLVMRVDNSSIVCTYIDRENPTKALQSMIEDLS